jgi:hypothetical protein
MEHTQPHGTPVIEFYTWSKTNGHTSSRLYITLLVNGGFVLGGQFLSEGDCDRLNIMTRVKVTKAKMKELNAKMVELRAIAKRGY